MKNFYWVVFFLATLTITTTTCTENSDKKEAPIIDIPVVQVAEENIPYYVEMIGQTFGYYDIQIRARVEGFLESRHFQEGSRVKKNQLLYTIDAQPFQAKVAEQESRLAQAQTNLVKTDADLKRIRPLAEKNAVSKSDLDAAVAKFEASQAEVEAAKAGVRLAKIEMGYTRIYSPINGIIGMTKAKEGDFVGREPNPVVLNTVSRVDTIQVRFSITEAQYLGFSRYERVQRNLEYTEKGKETEENLELILADNSVHEFKGHLDFADRQVNPETGTMMLQASFPNPEKIVRPGQYARIKALVTEYKGILIPQRCITELQGLYSVTVVNAENIIESRQVEIGEKIGNMWEIRKGLKAGEKIVLEGLQKVRPGMKINPMVQEFERKI
ncbi:efflux RND transporter periplasmic adaptor subunit [Flexithrix dorotheae]|uniref:efflux RND transporter periplasmic adaptor subunit n=1 Tax=Flexithrix dorotheae TaxID=70993 RepID=UPI000371A822|nr:efflux RND transporter periplasmic adaptor subunit [Flexithrix dorotheae]